MFFLSSGRSSGFKVTDRQSASYFRSTFGADKRMKRPGRSRICCPFIRVSARRLLNVPNRCMRASHIYHFPRRSIEGFLVADCSRRVVKPRRIRRSISDPPHRPRRSIEATDFLIAPIVSEACPPPLPFPPPPLFLSLRWQLCSC